MHSPQELFQIYKSNPKEETLVKLLQSLQPIIYAVCFKVVKNENDCHDVTQNVLLKLIRDVHQLKDVKVILGWVHQISFYSALEFKRDQIKQKALRKNIKEEYLDSNDDTTLVIHEHIQKLDKDSQQLILLKFFDNKTFEEIYQATGKAYSSAHYEIQKILSSLKTSLEKAGYFSAATSLEITLLSTVQLPNKALVLGNLVKTELKKVVYKKSPTFLTAKLITVATIILISTTTFFLFQQTNREASAGNNLTFSNANNHEISEKPLAAASINKPINQKQNNSVKEEVKVSPDKEPEIDFIPEDKAEELTLTTNKGKKESNDSAVISPYICFVDDHEKNVFDGLRLPMKDGVVPIDSETEISIIKSAQNSWLVELNSKKYFFNKVRNDLSKENNDSFLSFTGQNEVNKIVLSAYSIIKAKLENNDNYLFKDDMLCHWNGLQVITSNQSQVLNKKAKIKNNSAIYYVDFEGSVTIGKFYIGAYSCNFNKTIELKSGAITELIVSLEKEQEQTFQVIDSDKKVLEDYYVVFTEDSFINKVTNIDIDEIIETYAQAGVLSTNENIGKTDKNGLTKTMRHYFKEKEMYQCFVFGKNHSPQLFFVSSENTNKTIELQLTNHNKAQIKVYLNNELYLGAINFELEEEVTYLHEIHQRGSQQRLMAAQILSRKEVPFLFKNGIFEIADLPQRKFKFHLNSNEFYRDEFSIDMHDKDNVEIAIHLKPAEYFVHGVIQDKQGKPKPNITIDFNYANHRTSLVSDQRGYFKFSGMEPDKKCEIDIHGEGFVETDLNKSFSPSKEEIIIVVEDKKRIPLTVIGLDGKELLEYKYILYIYLKGRSFPNFMLGGIAKNGQLDDKVEAYGIYHFEIEAPNAPKIILDWPILKAEDIVPKTIYASQGFTFIGLLQDSNGKPIVDALFTQEAHIQLPFKDVRAIEIRINKDGKFKIENCGNGKFYWIMKEGYAPYLLEIKDESKNGETKITLLKTHTIKGKLLNSNNRPYEKASVNGYCKVKQKFSYEVIGIVSQDGSFLIEGLSLDRWDFTFSIEGKKDRLTKDIQVLEKNEDLNVIYDFKLNER